MKNLLMAAFIVAFTLSPANAQDEVGRWYLGAGIGQTKADDFCDSVVGFILTNCSNKDTSAKLYGGYNLHKNFAVEGGYIDFGEYQINEFNQNGGILLVSRSRLTIKQSIDSLFFAGMGKIHVHPKITLFGKIGMHRWNVDGLHRWYVFVNLLHDNNSSTYDSKGSDYFYGIGGEAAPFSNQKIKLRMEYEMFEFDGNRYLEFLGLGVTYTF